MKKSLIVLTLLNSILFAEGNPTVDEANSFIQKHEAEIRPLEKTMSLAQWDASVSGKDEDFKIKEETQNKLDRTLSDKAKFETLKKIHDTFKKHKKGVPPDVLRQIQLLYLQYLEKQVDPELLAKMTAKANAVEKAFNIYRAKLGTKEKSDSEIRKILVDSRNSKERQEAWEASKGVGKAVEANLKELVQLRNQSAVKLGFRNFHVLQLYLAEQKQEQVIQLFDELDRLTREPFKKAKTEIDEKLAQRYAISAAELRPWHYHDPFFQEAPSVYLTNLDQFYAKQDILKLSKNFYAGIGLPIDDILARSDLYEKKGKSPHAFCTDIDREGDVRVLANIVSNEYWMSVMLHELGHSVYSSKNIPKEVPYLLRGEAHILNTEGVAMMFQKLPRKAEWLAKMGVEVPDPKAFNDAGRRMARNELLIFSRWCQVMFRFEMSLYDSPDQDLNKLWWDLVEKYQLLKRPDGRNEPDYASKIHIVSAPVYYHNYMMGELFASQVHHTIAKQLYPKTPVREVIYVGNELVGDFMKSKVFAPGRRLNWNDLAKFATGRPLNASAFANDIK